MPRREGDPSHQREPEQLRPFELAADLAEFLAGEAYAMVTTATNLGTVYLVKAPARDIQSMGGRVPTEVEHQLYQHPLAPIVRTGLRSAEVAARTGELHQRGRRTSVDKVRRFCRARARHVAHTAKSMPVSLYGLRARAERLRGRSIYRVPPHADSPKAEMGHSHQRKCTSCQAAART
jgi:hypothetical protein